LAVDPSVYKILKRFPKKDIKAILTRIYLLPTNPYFGDVEKMKGEQDVWRCRVGSYRIFYRIVTKERAIVISHVKRRASKTY
jgi:mRNA-degrading endonuclease RelE of RelBE toxin-antitoxin system